MNECLSTPCQNGGTCANLINSFTCDCTGMPKSASQFEKSGLGYESTLCEEETDECLSTPCQNGGECDDQINQFVCNCTGTGFEGVVCEENIDECLSTPCLVACRAPAEFDVIEFRTAPLARTPCSGTCARATSAGRPRTARRVSTTARSSPARTTAPASTGTTRSLPGMIGHSRFTCDCVTAPGWEGRHCEIDTDECLSTPCQNDQPCVDVVAGFTCVMPCGRVTRAAARAPSRGRASSARRATARAAMLAPR